MYAVQVSRLKRIFLGQPEVLTLDERNGILARIKLGREMMAEIVKYTENLPEWAKAQPFLEMTKRYDEVLDIAAKESDRVRAIDTTLFREGPWLALSDAEIGSLSVWSNAIEELYDIYLKARPDPYMDVRTVGALATVGVLYTLVAAF